MMMMMMMKPDVIGKAEVKLCCEKLLLKHIVNQYFDG